MDELIKRLECVIQMGVPDKDGKHPISAETVLEVVKELSEHGTNLAEVGTDCISREQAIDAVRTVIGDNRSISVCEAIKQLPPIQPIQPKRGRWVGKYPVTSVCSECGYLINDSKVKVFAFCPNCGAKMEGEQDG